MKISDVEQRVNASYNTIKRFIEQESSYYEKINNVLHVTDEGLEELEKKYGIKTEILSEDNLDFYRNQITFLRQQLEENKQYNHLFLKQIESKDTKAEEDRKKIKELENRIYEQELEKIELKYELELEKNKSFFKKLFKK